MDNYLDMNPSISLSVLFWKLGRQMDIFELKQSLNIAGTVYVKKGKIIIGKWVKWNIDTYERMYLCIFNKKM